MKGVFIFSERNTIVFSFDIVEDITITKIYYIIILEYVTICGYITTCFLKPVVINTKPWIILIR